MTLIEKIEKLQTIACIAIQEAEYLRLKLNPEAKYLRLKPNPIATVKEEIDKRESEVNEIVKACKIDIVNIVDDIAKALELEIEVDKTANDLADACLDSLIHPCRPH